MRKGTVRSTGCGKQQSFSFRFDSFKTKRRDSGKDDLTSPAARMWGDQKPRGLDFSPCARDKRPERGIIIGSLVGS